MQDHKIKAITITHYYKKQNKKTTSTTTLHIQLHIFLDTFKEESFWYKLEKSCIYYKIHKLSPDLCMLLYAQYSIEFTSHLWFTFLRHPWTHFTFWCTLPSKDLEIPTNSDYHTKSLIFLHFRIIVKSKLWINTNKVWDM